MSQVIINIGDMFGSKSINLFPFAGLFKVFDEITFTDDTITFTKRDGTLIHIDSSSRAKGCIYLNGVRVSCERVVIREKRADDGYWCVDFDIFTLLGDIITTSEYSDRKFRLY